MPKLTARRSVTPVMVKCALCLEEQPPKTEMYRFKFPPNLVTALICSTCFTGNPDQLVTKLKFFKEPR